MITLGRNACCRNSSTQQGLHLTLLACTMDWRGCDTDFYTNFTSSEAEIGRGGTERLRGLKSAPEERPVTAVTGTRQWNCNPWDVKPLSERGKSTAQQLEDSTEKVAGALRPLGRFSAFAVVTESSTHEAASRQIHAKSCTCPKASWPFNRFCSQDAKSKPQGSKLEIPAEKFTFLYWPRRQMTRALQVITSS